MQPSHQAPNDVMKFEFSTATRIYFGNGTVDKVPRLAARLGRSPLLVTGRTSRHALQSIEGLRSEGCEAAVFRVSGEPTVERVAEGRDFADQNDCDAVIALGGGSVIDTGKAIAALLTNRGDIYDYMEVIGRGLPLRQPPLGMIAVPTTAGTGAEVTSNAVLADRSHGVKVSLRHPSMFPRAAVVDPRLTASMPPAVTAATGLDALTQVLEPYVSVHANPMTDVFCQEGLKRAAGSLLNAFQAGDDLNARQDMALASLLGGLALSNAKLGAVHGFAAAIGGIFDAPHGAVCGCLLPVVMEANIRALRKENARKYLSRFDRIAAILTGLPEASAEEGVRWVQELCQTLAVPGLAAYGMTKADFHQVVKRAKNSSSFQGNPVRLSEKQMHEILEIACQ